MEDWKMGRLEEGKAGRGEGWKRGRVCPFHPSIFPSFQSCLGCAFLIPFIIFSIIGCGEDADLKRGKRLAETGDHAAAIDHFTATLQRKPNHAEARYRLALAYGELAKYDEAIAELKTASQLEPKRSEITFALGRMYWLTGRQKDAIGHFLEVLKGSPEQRLMQQIASLIGDSFRVKRLEAEVGDDYSQAFSADGKMVTFTAKYSDDHSPALSPDGKSVAFASYRLQNAEIYLMDTTGRNLTQLTHTDAINEYMSTFSPDGKLIAFVAERKMSGEATITVQSSGSTPSNAAVYLMDSDGRNQRRLTNARAVERAPAFSPDSQQVVFESSENAEDLEIFVIDVDGKNRKQLTTNDVDDGHPVFSPDGKQIAFTSMVDKNYEIYLMDVDGGNLKRLTHNDFGDYQPAFSPDGKRIVFVSNQNNDYELWIMDVTGANREQLTSSVGVNLEPRFSFDGEQIVFSSDRPGYMRVYMMDLARPFQKEELQTRLHQMLEQLSPSEIKSL